MTACLTLGRVARKPAGEELPGARRVRPCPPLSRLTLPSGKRMAIRFTIKLIRYVKPRIDIPTGNALISADSGVGVRCQISRPIDSERGPFAGFAIEAGPAPVR